MLIDVSHVLTALGSAAIGASGRFAGAWGKASFEKWSAKRDERKRLAELKGLMPALIGDMRNGLTEDKSRTIRQFFVLANPAVIVSSDRNRFVFYESVHRDIHNQVAMLQDAGFVQELPAVDAFGFRLFRFSEEFVRLLARD